MVRVGPQRHRKKNSFVDWCTQEIHPFYLLCTDVHRSTHQTTIFNFKYFLLFSLCYYSIRPWIFYRKLCDFLNYYNYTCILVRFTLKMATWVAETCWWTSMHYFFFYHDETAPSGRWPPHYRSFTITFRHTTFGATPLDVRSARGRDLFLTRHNVHKRQTSMPPTGFEPAFPAS